MDSFRAAIIVGSVAILIGCQQNSATDQSRPNSPTTQPAATQLSTAENPRHDSDGQNLFNGKDLSHWKSTDFGGQGEVAVENGELVLPAGNPLTGVTWQGPVPMKMSYQIDLDASRVEGSDFFCALTFPVNDDCASLIIGGWGGGLCGISCLNYNDAANNETTKIMHFKNGKWYHIRMRVLPNRLIAWLDDEKIVDVDTTDKKISVRTEVEPSQPLGIASYQTTAALKHITIRKVDPNEKIPKDDDKP